MGEEGREGREEKDGAVGCGSTLRRMASRLQGEEVPAELVAATLILEDQLSDLLRELLSLPVALPPPGLLLLSLGCGRHRCLDGVRRGAQVVGRDVRDHRGLTCCESCMPRRADVHPGCCHGMSTGGSGLAHPELAPHPRPDPVERLTGPQIIGID